MSRSAAETRRHRRDRVPFMQHGEHLPYRTEFTGWSWSDGVRGTVPFWYHGKVRPAE